MFAARASTLTFTRMPPAPLGQEPLSVTRLSTSEQPAAPLSPDDLRRFDRACARWRPEIRFDGPAVRVRDARIDPSGVVGIDWYTTRFSHSVAFERESLSLPPERRHPGLAFLVHLRCREGWVVTRRSPSVASAPGRWQPAAAEGADPGDLSGGLDPSRVAWRALAEELGLTQCEQVPQILFQPRPAGAPNHYLHLVLEHVDITLDDVICSQRSAPDAWECDRVDILSTHHPGPWLDHLWLPS